MAAPVVEAFSVTVTSGDQTSVVVTVPAGSGSLLVAWVAEGQGGLGPVDLHAAWADTPIGLIFSQQDAAASGRCMYRYAASEPASYTFTKSGSPGGMIGGIVRISGAHSNDPFNAANTGGTNTNDILLEDLVTTVDECLALRMFVIDNSGPDSQNNAPTGHTAMWARGNTTATANNCGAGCCHKTQAVAGAIGQATWPTGFNDAGWANLAIQATSTLKHVKVVPVTSRVMMPRHMLES